MRMEDCNISLKVLFIWGWKVAQLFDAAVCFPSYMLLFTSVFNTLHLMLLNIASV